MKNIIITGFKPFGPYKFNPVEESTQYFNGKQVGGFRVKGVVLPCTYLGAFKILKEEILKVRPVAVISTGLSSGVMGIRFETTSINIMSGKYSDADGYKPKNVPIVKNGDRFLKTNSNNVHLAGILKDKQFPVELSSDADTFICNSLLYLTADYIKRNNLRIKHVFIHIPWTENYSSKIKLEPHKRMIPRQTLFDSIRTIIENLS